MLRAEIDDLYARSKKVFSGEGKRAMYIRIRRNWLKLCALSIGVQYTPRGTVWGFYD
jgi:hypothetical protein